MRQIDSAETLRNVIHESRCAGKSIGFVPTMGYLHGGHLRLADVCRAENDLSVLSIFVNPTQFGPGEDFGQYPRDLPRDRELAVAHGVDVLFLPTVEQMYPDGTDGQRIWVDPGALGNHLEGAARPGHFRGVATVVAKLFHVVQPDRAYFGQKDAQQASIVQKIVRDLAMAIEIRIIPTVREQSGLALSSRNVYLSAREREQAAALFNALGDARSAIESGERDASHIEAIMQNSLRSEAPDGCIGYASVTDLESLQPITGKIDHDALVSLAVSFGTTRLIDNIVVRLMGDVPDFS
jgi:pantoate--beta-alanine ligase